jgi:hypothetical protein
LQFPFFIAKSYSFSYIQRPEFLSLKALHVDFEIGAVCCILYEDEMKSNKTIPFPHASGAYSSNCQMLSSIGAFGYNSVVSELWGVHHGNSGFGGTSSIQATFFFGDFNEHCRL